MSSAPYRKDNSSSFQWDLSAQYPSVADWERDVAALEKEYSSLDAFKGTLHDPATLGEFLPYYETLSERFESVYVYANMTFTEDMSNTQAQERVSRIEVLQSKIATATTFIKKELSVLSQEVIDATLREYPHLEKYRYFLLQYTRYAPHVLSQETEDALSQIGIVLDKAEDIFSTFNNVSISFPSVEHNGSVFDLSHGMYGKLMESPDRELREKVYHAYYEPFIQSKDLLGQTYATQVLATTRIAQVRKYRSSLHMNLFSDSLDEKVYTTLVEVAQKTTNTLQEYYRYKQETLQVGALQPYDLSAPLSDHDHRYTYPEVIEISREALKILGDEYIKKYDDALTSRVVDVYENKYKRSGAYSWGSYNSRGYIFLNFTGKGRDLSTFIHEMGHCLHRDFSIQQQPYIYYQNPIILAEIASTCNEILLYEYMLKNETDSDRVHHILEEYSKLFAGTFFRQTMFADFEQRVHSASHNDEPLTTQMITGTYANVLSEYYGDTITLDETIVYEWSRVPHFYTPFYVYKYATSVCVATVIAQRILEKQEGAVEQYLEFLSAGSHKEPAQILADMGINLTDSAVYCRAAEKLQELVQKMRAQRS